jgi:acetate kinase/phosphoesterase RecJ-like protein
MFLKLLDLIKEYDYITLYRHTNPDCDAFGSQFGLKSWITDNFPQKKVYCLGDSSRSNFFDSDEVDDEVVAKSLAIILDVSSSDRIDDSRFKIAKYRVRIDHHPDVEDLEDLRISNTKYASTCEIVAEFMNKFDSEYKVSKETASRLYRGIITDTMSFKTTNTTSNSLRMAAYLVDKKINIPELNADIYNIEYEDFKFNAYLRNKVELDEGLGYVIFEEKELSKMKISMNKAKSFVSSLSGVNQFEIWAIFVKSNEGNYDISLRSKKVRINDIAEKFGGGGHYNASGIKGLNEEQYQELLNNLHSRIKGIN